MRHRAYSRGRALQPVHGSLQLPFACARRSFQGYCSLTKSTLRPHREPETLDEDVLITGKILLLIAGVTGPIAFCLWYFQIRGRSLFPPQRHRSVPWTGWQISLAVFSVFLLCPVL